MGSWLSGLGISRAYEGGCLSQEVAGKTGAQICFLPSLEYCSSIINLVYFLFFVTLSLVLMLYVYMGEQILLFQRNILVPLVHGLSVNHNFLFSIIDVY